MCTLIIKFRSDKFSMYLPTTQYYIYTNSTPSIYNKRGEAQHQTTLRTTSCLLRNTRLRSLAGPQPFPSATPQQLPVSHSCTHSTMHGQVALFAGCCLLPNSWPHSSLMQNLTYLIGPSRPGSKEVTRIRSISDQMGMVKVRMRTMTRRSG